MTTLTLDVRDVSKRFGEGDTAVAAVRGVSLAVEPGEVVLIMGPSGSGKTTLLSMMGALLRPTTGSIHLDGTELSALSEGRLPDIRLRQFGFIFQDFNLLSALTVRENVALVAELAGLKTRAARDKATALLTELGLGERLDFLPEKLSGGEKQRVAIARALINDPTLILADEPTANLDSKIGHEIMRLLRADRQGAGPQRGHRQPRPAHPRHRRSGPVAGGRRLQGHGDHGHRPGVRDGRRARAGGQRAARRGDVLLLLEWLPGRVPQRRWPGTARLDPRGIRAHHTTHGSGRSSPRWPLAG